MRQQVLNPLFAAIQGRLAAVQSAIAALQELDAAVAEHAAMATPVVGDS